MIFSKVLKNEFETALVNEPPVFEPLKFDCISLKQVPGLKSIKVLAIHCKCIRFYSFFFLISRWILISRLILRDFRARYGEKTFSRLVLFRKVAVSKKRRKGIKNSCIYFSKINNL